MNMKKIAALLTSFALTAALGSTALAASPSAGGPQSFAPALTQNREGKNFTEEQRAQMRERRQQESEKLEAIQKKWDSLTDKQKSEIYGIHEQMAKLKKQMVDKYAEFGLIDKDTATKVKERIDSRNEKMKENGKMMPMLGLGRHRGGNRACKNAPAQ